MENYKKLDTIQRQLHELKRRVDWLYDGILDTREKMIGNKCPASMQILMEILRDKETKLHESFSELTWLIQSELFLPPDEQQ